MTTIPFKLRVLTALTDAIKSISTTDGYLHTLADANGEPRVFRGRQWFGDGDPMPMVSVLEGISPADEVAEAPVDTNTGEYDWPILVQGFVKDDPVNPTDPAYRLLADVRRRLAAERKRRLPTDPTEPDILGLGASGKNRVVRLTIGPGVVRPADDVSANAYFWLTLTLRIIDNPDAPFL